MQALEAEVERLGADTIACVLTTTSCFAPRASDDVVAVARLCAAAGVGHIINNAYGVQSAALCAAVAAAWRRGRVDAVVQSTDKNFMVPVGGAVIAARRGATHLVSCCCCCPLTKPQQASQPTNQPADRPTNHVPPATHPRCLPQVDAVRTLYPGRASMSPLLDLLITLLHWGAAGWRRVLQERERLYPAAAAALRSFAEQQGERVLHTPGNPISLGLTLTTLGGSEGSSGSQPATAAAAEEEAGGEEAAAEATAAAAAAASTAIAALIVDGSSGSRVEPPSSSAATPPPTNTTSITFLGSMLFQRCVSGTRVVARGRRQQVGGLPFEGYGAHCDAYPVDYLTVAAALGGTEDEVAELVRRLGTCFHEFQRRAARSSSGRASAATVDCPTVEGPA